ncbi:MAG: YDG domain-containing protein, partial [Verrucomicrobia bacterium]|nr:YDG domain-containing protein [Verrucomicrobiota bacterium]
YGQTLAASTLSGGTATPAGTFAFTTPSTAPNAGTAVQIVTYTPTDNTNYKTARSVVSVTVNKASPSVTAWPTANAITYGQSLAATTLSGGWATPAGRFAFTTPSSAPNAGTAAQNVTYRPTDAVNYNTASSTVSVTVNPKALTVTGIKANDKVYDGNTTATLNTTGATLVGKVLGDDVALNTAGATGAFTNPDVGTAKTVLVSGLTLSGADAGNYTLTQPTTTAKIKKANSATGLVPSQNASWQGSEVTFTATVASVAMTPTTPTGNVQFYTNGVALGSPVALTDGVASLSTADLPPGTNTVLAAYLGDSKYLGSSDSLLHVVAVVTSRPTTPSTIGIQHNADGTVTVTFAGTPDAGYVVQASDSLAPPAWENVSTNTAGPDGQWTFTESTEHHPVRFYRSAIP